MSFLIRAATRHDLPTIRALLGQTWHATYDDILGPEQVEAITRRWHALENLARQFEAAEAGGDTSFTVALVDGDMVGTALATRVAPADGGLPMVNLQRIYIRREMQGRGLGRALLTATLKPFADAGRIRLEVHPKNANAIAFYHAIGFGQVSAGHACGDDKLAAIPHLVLEAKLPLMLLRPAEDADAQDLFGLLTLCFAEYPGCFTDPHDDLPDLVRPGHWPERQAPDGRPMGGAFLVLEDARGRVCASLAYDFPTPGEAELHRLYVRPDCRRKGIAARLLAHVEARARKDGATKIRLWSDTRFGNAHRLYQACGYRMTGATRELNDISRSTEYEFIKNY